MSKFFCINSLIVLLIFVFSTLQQPVFSQVSNNSSVGKQGVLDLNSIDVPLSYIDRSNYLPDDQQSLPQYTPQQQQKNFDMLNDYIQAQKIQKQIQQQHADSQIDDLIKDISKTKKAFDDSRKSYKYYPDYVYNPYDPYCPYKQDESYFTTKIRPYDRPCDRVDSRYYGYNSYINVFNIPGYLNNTEQYYDALDNDSDGFIDEGFHNGNVQIILGDSGVTKDDVWSLYLDGKYMGENTNGSIRNWDLHLYPGSHTVSIVGSHIPDGSGTYSIFFRNASVISGPPLVGENLSQGQTLQWVINVR